MMDLDPTRVSSELHVDRLRRTLRTFDIQIDMSCVQWPLVILGPSGAGKTQLLRMLAGLERPAEGTIRFGDTLWFDSSSGVEIPTHRRNIGFGFQDPFLLPHRSVLSNVMFPLESQRPRSSGIDRKEKARKALARFKVEHLSEARPSQLSGGEKGRVALARSVVHQPSLLLLDEPFANLDPPTRDQLLEDAVEVLAKGAAPVIWVTHSREEAKRLGGSVAILLRGHLAQLGPTGEIFAKPATEEVAQFLGVEGP